MNQLLRIYKVGSSRAVNVTKLLPEDWVAVNAEVTERGEDYVTVKFSAAVKEDRYGRPVTTDASIIE